MQHRFVIVTGLPGSGKTTLAAQLAAALDLPMLDKDAILEQLFDTRGTGDAAHRRSLSRESDAIFQARAAASTGAVLVSFWHQPGMAHDSGTPTAWLSALPAPIVNVHCVCPPEVAAERFIRRARHPGHLDSQRSHAQLLQSLETLASLPPLDLGPRIEVDTTCPIDLSSILHAIGTDQSGDVR
ncbi:MAG: AAA family ATPase [Candidatus Solibacter sp.]